MNFGFSIGLGNTVYGWYLTHTGMKVLQCCLLYLIKFLRLGGGQEAILQVNTEVTT